MNDADQYTSHTAWDTGVYARENNGVGVGVVTGTRSQSGNGWVHSPDMASHVAVAAKARTVLIARLRTSRGVETLRGIHW